MLFYLGNYLNETVEVFSFLRLVDSIIFRALAGALTALLLTILFGDKLILIMYKNGHRDIPRDYLDFSPSVNSAAKPVKTYGGPLLIGVIYVSIVLWCKIHTGFVVACLISFTFFAVIGWIDDCGKLRGDDGRGLSKKQKFFWQSIVAACAAYTLFATAQSPVETQLIVPSTS